MITFARVWRLVSGKIIPSFPVDMNTQKISKVVDPTENQEASTKKYVDDHADMLKSVYDPNADGVVKDSDKLEGSSKSEVRVHEPLSHDHLEADITDLDHDAQKIKNKPVDAPTVGDDGKALTYNYGEDRYKHVVGSAVFPAPNIESTWQSIANNASFGFNHNLGTDNILVQVWANNVASWTNAYIFLESSMATSSLGLIRRSSNNQLTIFNKTGADLYFKIRMWKWT